MMMKNLLASFSDSLIHILRNAVVEVLADTLIYNFYKFIINPDELRNFIHKLFILMHQSIPQARSLKMIVR